MKKKKWFKLKIFLVICLVGTLYVVGSFYFSMSSLMTTTYEYKTNKVNEDVDIIALTDMHNHIFGKNGEDLIKKVKSEK